MHGLSLQEQQINQLKTIFANAGSNNIDSERFKQITDFIQSKLDNIGQSQTNTKLNQLEEDIKKETKTVNARKNQLDDIDKYKDELVKKEITNIKQKKMKFKKMIEILVL